MVKIISVQNNMEAAVLRFVVMAIATRCLTRPALRVIALQNNKININFFVHAVQ